MNDNPKQMTATEIIAIATETLLDGGYKRVSSKYRDWDTSSSRLFEDDYGVVGVVVFDTCEDLLKEWPELQGSLVDVISKNITRTEYKSWDGYLVLLTSNIAPSLDTELSAIRQDTLRLRKLVASGEEIRESSDVKRVLKPLLPLSMERAQLGQASVLDLLPELLLGHSIPEETTRMLIDAFSDQLPLVEQLHRRSDEL